MEEVNNAKELLQETVALLRERKTAGKALNEVHKRVLQTAGGDKALWKQLAKAYANKGKAWAAGPLVLDKAAKHKDIVTPTLAKLLSLITATELYDMTDDLLSDYFDALAEVGIKITIDHDKFEHAHVDALDVPVEEELKSAKAYMSTMESYSDEIRDEHAPKAEELNFAPASAYSRVVNIYRKGISGKEIDDDVQNILTFNELLDSAVNLTADYAKAVDPDKE